MGGRGRPRKKDPLPKGGAATKTTDLKDDNGEQNSISVEETNKEQTEVVKLVARDPNQMGLEMEKSELLSLDLGEKEGDAEGILLDLAGLMQGQRKSGFDAGPKDGRADKGKREAGPVEGKGAKGKKGVRLETQPSVIQMKQPSGEKDASSTSGTAMPPSARWSDLIEKEKGEFQPTLKQKPLRNWASVVEGNRDINKGWDLQYIKPQDPTGAVVITKDEWVKGSKIWENALVPKAFMLRNGVFLFDFGNGDAKHAVLERRWTFNGHPLILKQWTLDFDPDNLDISKIPVWIQFPELHLSLWNPESLGKLASYVGVPIATDALTAKRQRVAYARMLVEMEIMDTLPRVVPIIGPKGAYFTWSNKQGENDRLWCKLDRVMANTTWVSAFPNTSVVFLNPQSSDHSPSLVTVDVLMNEKPRPFRFCNAWSKDDNFLDLVREAWSVDIQGCPMFVVVQKLKLVKQKMKQLHKNRYGNLEGRIKDMAAELQNVQASMQNALFDETLVAKEKELQRELTKLERANLSVIAQRAKVTWLKEMDSNSAYFHAKVKERQHRSVINSILNCEGVRVTQPELIEQEFLMFYQNLFGKAKEGVQAVDMNVIRRGRVLTTEESEELCRPFTAKEVEIALFSIPSNKSPGPGGFTSGFYRVAWSIIKNDVTAAVLDFFDSGKILKQINATNITIVPKVSCPNVVSDYRPIACCNVIYKADEESTVLMMQKFEEFGRVSGLEVNRMKSQVFFSGVREGQKVALIQKLGFAEGQLPIRYLGLPLISKKLSPGACRVQLVNSVLFHIQVFWSGALLIPKKVLKLIDVACRNFIWCGKWNYNAMSLVAWDDVCVPRKEGGLGVKQLLHWNKAALGKLVWNICQHQESLWVKWAQVVLFRGENFWKVKIPADCAWTWRQVLKLRPLLKNIIWMQVGDGRQVSLFCDWWAGELRFCELISKDKIAVWGHDLTVSEWWDGLDWTIPDSFVRRHPMLVQIIRCQKLSQQVDKAIWKPAKNGLFTISSCYQFLRVKRPKAWGAWKPGLDLASSSTAMCKRYIPPSQEDDQDHKHKSSFLTIKGSFLIPLKAIQRAIKIQQFLSSVLSQRGPSALPYVKDTKWLIRQHLVTLMSHFPSLEPKTSTFTHNDGRRRQRAKPSATTTVDLLLLLSNPDLGSNKRKYKDPTPPSSGGRRPTGFSSPDSSNIHEPPFSGYRIKSLSTAILPTLLCRLYSYYSRNPISSKPLLFFVCAVDMLI
ncbi:hypothetical protein SLEP1_g16984 [Rubroshorea leprosula]|uniref:DUF4283 domain-containing protein n=1 Tax=Rubroshorea leprosula TaxID=152421 RepID=A0AAV5IYI5_9ROSI|nr:hypothetical protein SLEP1_g16984 [Rubroshorea leprosula]